MTIITDLELKNICDNLLNAPNYYNDDMNRCLNVIHEFGLRTNEIFQPNDKFSIDSNLNVIIDTFKGSNPRVLDRSLFDSVFYSRIQNNIAPVQFMRHSVINYYIRQVNYPKIYYSGNQEITTYLFRYNRIRQMKIQGFTNQQITSYFGWVSNSIVLSYLNNEIYY